MASRFAPVPEIRRTGAQRADADYVDVTAGGETKKNVYCYLGRSSRFRRTAWPQSLGPSRAVRATS